MLQSLEFNNRVLIKQKFDFHFKIYQKNFSFPKLKKITMNNFLTPFKELDNNSIFEFQQKELISFHTKNRGGGHSG